MVGGVDVQATKMTPRTIANVSRNVELIIFIFRVPIFSWLDVAS
jgi:hypothetical protein